MWRMVFAICMTDGIPNFTNFNDIRLNSWHSRARTLQIWIDWISSRINWLISEFQFEFVVVFNLFRIKPQRKIIVRFWYADCLCTWLKSTLIVVLFGSSFLSLMKRCGVISCCAVGQMTQIVCHTIPHAKWLITCQTSDKRTEETQSMHQIRQVHYL